MPDVAGDEVIGSGSLGALEELVVVRIGSSPYDPSWCNDVALAPDQLEQLLAKPLADFEFRAGQNQLVFREDSLRTGYILAGFVMASISVVRWSPSGFRAADTRCSCRDQPKRDYCRLESRCGWP